MSVKKGDFIGFTYNNKHSSDLGIVRTSDGSRFDENLLPAIQDKTVPVPGGDGSYYFGSYYGPKTFSVSFAFDSLTEAQFSNLSRHFGDRQIHELIFDERPYKVYQAKVTGSATIKHICFNDPKYGRIYKGEGSIQFTAYYPFARAKHKFLEEYSEENLEEWKAASGITNKGAYDVLSGSKIPLYNPGDKETDWILTIKFLSDEIPKGSIYLDGKGVTKQELSFERMTPQLSSGGKDTVVKFSSKSNLIEGYYQSGGRLIKSGNLYNVNITGGSFFKIPQTQYEDNEAVPMNFVFNNEKNITLHLDREPLEYDYYYF